MIPKDMMGCKSESRGFFWCVSVMISDSKCSLFIFGLGYVGQRLGWDLMAENGQVGGTTRNLDQAKSLRDQGFEAVTWTGGDPLPEGLNGATHVLITIPPNEQGDVILHHHDFPVLPHLKWVGYLSTTSVYGDHQGAWVTEESPLRPSSSRAQQRLLAENQWRSVLGCPLHIFRLSGIYGPGRSVLDSIRAGTAQRVDKPGHVFSRIHVDDIVRVLKASMAAPRPGEIYNLADDEPAASSDVVACGCALLKVAPPPLIPFAEASLSPMMRAFYADHKRVDNAKMKKSFDIDLKYPTYRDGLKDCS